MDVESAICVLKEWGASPEEICKILGLEADYENNPRSLLAPNKDVEVRSAIIGVMDQYLRILLPEEHARWARVENDAPLFSGAPPMTMLATGELSDIRKVKTWLAGWVHG